MNQSIARFLLMMMMKLMMMIIIIMERQLRVSCRVDPFFLLSSEVGFTCHPIPSGPIQSNPVQSNPVQSILFNRNDNTVQWWNWLHRLLFLLLLPRNRSTCIVPSCRSQGRNRAEGRRTNKTNKDGWMDEWICYNIVMRRIVCPLVLPCFPNTNSFRTRTAFSLL